MGSPETVVVFSGGLPPRRAVLGSIPPGAPIVAADRGAEHALALGLRVELAVGDFDSISAVCLRPLERLGRATRAASGCEGRDRPRARARRRRRARAAPDPRRRRRPRAPRSSARRAAAARRGRLRRRRGRRALRRARCVHVIRGERRLSGVPRELISLFALHGEARGVLDARGSSTRCGGELLRGRLEPRASRTSSRLPRRESRSEAGVLVAVRPGRRAPLAALRAARRSVREGSGSS